MASETQSDQTTISADDITDFAIKFLSTGKPLSVLKGLTRQDLDDLYWVGHSHYSGGNYELAERTFHALCLYDHKELRNWLGFGASLQMQGKLEPAITAYSVGQLMNLESPEPAFHAFECHLALENYREAAAALETVLSITNNKPKHGELHRKAEGLLKELNAALSEAGVAA